MQLVKAAEWQRPEENDDSDIREAVADMMAEIRAEGLVAIKHFSQTFDGFDPQVIELKPWRDYDLPAGVADHLATAAARIRRFAEAQFAMYRDLSIADEFGQYGQRIVAIDSMAAYVPGGRFPLPSTALMTLIPAAVAGVQQRVAVSPSDNPSVLAAASLAGATGFIRLGGAQAIGAMAYGSELHPSVAMVVGPGNAYVNAAKALVQDKVKIDTLAGPSEILVLCDDSVDPQWLALDILAQAEHDPMALSVLATMNDGLLRAVADAIITERAKNPDKESGVIQYVLCDSVDDVVQLANTMGPEHLHLACREDLIDPARLHNYGSLFIGPYSAVALGDYCTGPNHTLPTLGYAQQKGGLSVGDFLKILTQQRINPAHYNRIADVGIGLAELEGLDYHAKSLKIRQG